jgi:hypothetical protein
MMAKVFMTCWFDSSMEVEVWGGLREWLRCENRNVIGANAWIASKGQWGEFKNSKIGRGSTISVSDASGDEGCLTLFCDSAGVGLTSRLRSIWMRSDSDLDVEVLDVLLGFLGVAQCGVWADSAPRGNDWWGVVTSDASLSLDPLIVNERIVGPYCHEYWVNKSFNQSQQLVASMPDYCGVTALQHGYRLEFAGPGMARMALEQAGFAGWKQFDKFLALDPSPNAASHRWDL